MKKEKDLESVKKSYERLHKLYESKTEITFMRGMPLSFVIEEKGEIFGRFYVIALVKSHVDVFPNYYVAYIDCEDKTEVIGDDAPYKWDGTIILSVENEHQHSFLPIGLWLGTDTAHPFSNPVGEGGWQEIAWRLEQMSKRLDEKS